jgi:hypothetical protein
MPNAIKTSKSQSPANKLSKDREQHLKTLLDLFKFQFAAKYRKGSTDHKEKLWTKDDFLENALLENLDQFAYIASEMLRRKEHEEQVKGLVDTAWKVVCSNQHDFYPSEKMLALEAAVAPFL